MSPHMIEKSPLYRTEAIAAVDDAFGGALPSSAFAGWFVTLGFFVMLIAVSVAIMTIRYERVEVVNGELVYDTGMAVIAAPVPGQVVDVLVEAGQKVQQGSLLVDFSERSAASDSPVVQHELSNQLNARLEAISRRRIQVEETKRVESTRIATELQGLAVQGEHIDNQLSVLAKHLALAEQDIDHYRKANERGLVSRRELREKEIERLRLLARIEELREVRAVADKQVATLGVERELLVSEAEMRKAELDQELASARQEVAEATARIAFPINAPIDGRVAAILVRPGQRVPRDATLVVVIPSDAKLEAQIAIPPRAISYASVNSEVGVRLDAFPYQRYGKQTGKLTSMSEASVRLPDSHGTDEEDQVYLATVRLESPLVFFDGQRYELREGMTVQVDIIAESMSILEMLLEPLYRKRPSALRDHQDVKG